MGIVMRREEVLRPTRALPRLTAEQRVLMAAIDLAGGRPLCEVELRHPDGREYTFTEWGEGQRVTAFRRLIRDGLVEVVSMGPAVYRVTRLGQAMRRVRG